MTQAGITCPICLKGKTEFVAILTTQDQSGKDLDPADYAVCKDCYRKQHKLRYPHQELPA